MPEQIHHLNRNAGEENLKPDAQRRPFHVQLGLKPGDGILMRPDQWFYLVSFPFALLFARLRLDPNTVGFASLFCGLGYIAGVCLGIPGHWYFACLGLLGIRIILDCADGQLARLSGRVSSLGALYDLVSDFLFLILITVSLAALLVRQGQASACSVALCILGFLSAAMAATIHSFYDTVLASAETDLSQAAHRFVRPPENDRRSDSCYTAKMKVLSLLFNIGWGSVSKTVVSLLCHRMRLKYRRLFMLLLFPAEFGVQMTVLLVMTGMRADPMYYVLFQIAAFCYAGILTAAFGRG